MIIMTYAKKKLLLPVFCPFIVSYALQINQSIIARKSSWAPSNRNQYRHVHANFRHVYRTILFSTTDKDETSDEALLAEVDISTLQNLCSQYSLSQSGTKQELLTRLRDFANTQAENDRKRHEGRKERVESNLDGKARHTFVDEPWSEEEDDDEVGFFYFDAGETEEEKKKRKQKSTTKKKKPLMNSLHITAPNPDEIQPNEKGERVVTIYSTTDNNDLTGMQAPSMSMDEMGGKPLENSPEDSLIGGPFGDMSGSKRKKEDDEQLTNAKEKLRQLVGDLLATTGAPAFQDDYDEESEDERGDNSFAVPYGFVGFQPERIPAETLVDSSHALLMQNGKALHEIMEEYELQAIGHDGMAADDKENGGGHYQEVEKVRSFLNGFRKSEERRIARETSTMLLDKLVKEGVAGLDQMLSTMPKEGDDISHMFGSGGMEAGVLNSALIRYLDEAIREQEQRVEYTQTHKNDGRLDAGDSSNGDEQDLSTWNITKGEDGTIIETVDLNDPVLRAELTKAQDVLSQNKRDDITFLTLQEKILLLLNLLRERVKVEAVMGRNEQAKNLKVLAYCLKAVTVEERRKFILSELGASLDVSMLHMLSDMMLFVSMFVPMFCFHRCRHWIYSRIWLSVQ